MSLGRSEYTQKGSIEVYPI